MRKKLPALALACFLFFVAPLTASAHKGRTDDSGGHTDYSTGEYHYHHGYSAHQHYDMDGDGIIDCPYDFDDQTNHNSGSSSSSKKSTTATTAPQSAEESDSSPGFFTTLFQIIIGFVCAIAVVVFAPPVVIGVFLCIAKFVSFLSELFK